MALSNGHSMNEKLAGNNLPDADISVVDVYDLASDIGKECEKIIDLYGAEALTALMPKVVHTLEQLEAMASRNENENTTIQTLTDRVAYLESEKIEKAVFRERLQRELEAIEEQWHNETIELAALVSRLQEENRRIKQSDTPTHSASTSSNSSKSPKRDSANLLNESDFQKMQRLRGQMEKQRDELMCRDQEIEEKNTEIENFSIQLERLRSSGRESRKRQKMLQNQVKKLLEERSDLLLRLHDQNKEINVLRRSLGVTESEMVDVPLPSPPEPSQDEAEVKQLITERDNLKKTVQKLENELKEFKPKAVTVVPTPVAEEASPDDKFVDINVDVDEIDEDAPVQGPLPYEPDDAPWKKSSDTGVRKFFRKLFAEPSTTSFPRRSLSALSKMALPASPSRSAAI